MKKNVKEDSLVVTDFKLYYKVLIIETIYYWLRNREVDQWHGLGSK